MKRNLPQELYTLYYNQLWKRRINEINPSVSVISTKKLKTMPKSNLYYQQFKPIFILLRLFGRLQLQVPSKGKFTCRIFSWIMLYCVISYILQTYLAILAAMKRIRIFKDTEGDYDEVVFAVHVLIYLNIHFHLPFTYWIQCSQIAEYLNQWMVFQEKWKSVFEKEMKLSLKRAVIWFTVITIPVIIIFLVLQQFATLHDPCLFMLPYFFTICSTILVVGLWYCTCIELGRLAQTMIEELNKNLELRPAADFLCHWRYLWIDLSMLTSSLGSSFCSIISSIMITFSITFLLGFYTTLSLFIVNDLSWSTFGFMTASLSSLFVIFALCNAGHDATNKIGTAAMDCLLKSRMPFTYPQEVIHEIDLLLKAIESNQPEISLGGFITINRSLFMSFASNSLTYLIVLLQFKSSNAAA